MVTVLFADVVGSTALGESRDPEDLRRLLGRFYRIAQQVVDEHAGTLITRALGSGMRLLEAQARRLRGIQRGDIDELALSLAIFEEIGAGRYAARVRTELGTARGDGALLSRGMRELEAMGELQQLKRLSSR